MSQEALIERLRLLMSGESGLCKTEFAQNTLTAAIEALSAQDVARAPLTDEQRNAIQECIDYLTPAAKEFSDLGLPGMGDSKHARCIRTLRLILAAPAAPAVAPEGCTPADAQMLRAANHQLAAENDYLRRRLRPFAQIASSPLSWAMVEYCVEGDPEKQTLQAPQMQRAFNRAADALRENVPSHEPADCEALDLPDWIKNAKPPAPAQAEKQACAHCKCNYPLHDLDCPVAVAGMREKAEQQRDNPPFSNCSFRLCDLPGQCRGEGKCHHPKVEQQGDGGASSWRADVQKVLDALDPDDWCGDESMISALTRALSASEQPSARVELSDQQILDVFSKFTMYLDTPWQKVQVGRAILAASTAQGGKS